jgi:23S rRNA-intervening sequence protein
MKSVEDLDVFKLAHQLALKTYSTTKVFPREETFSLVDQMRRAATSVGMNLMEGAMRLGSREYSAVRWHRKRLGRRSLLSITSRQRFEVYFRRNVSGVALRL